MRIRTVVASTRRDRHGDMIVREALEDAARQVNEGPTAVAFMMNHDRILPPLGKGIKAQVEPSGDGEFTLVTESDLFDLETPVVLEDGSILVSCQSETDERPFARPHSDEGGSALKITVDLINIDSPDDLKNVLSEVRSISGCELETRTRKALLPAPELTFTLGQSAIDYLARKILDVAVEAAIMAAFAAFVRQVKVFLSGYAKQVVPKNVPGTYIFVVPGTPTVEFAARTSSIESVLPAIEDERLPAALRKAYHMAKPHNAQMIQFVLSDNGDWEFNYMLTPSGGVICTVEGRKRGVAEMLHWLRK